MDKSKTYDLGKKAEKLLDNDAFTSAVSNAKKGYFEEFCRLSHRDTEMMVALNLQMNAIDSIVDELKDLVVDGNNAKNKLNK